jgi:hypothetical protein
MILRKSANEEIWLDKNSVVRKFRTTVKDGKSKKPVAMLVPFEENAKKRKIGIPDGKATIILWP